MRPVNPVPDLLAMRQHLDWIVGPCTWCECIEIAWGPPALGPIYHRNIPTDARSRALGEAVRANLIGNNVYVGVTLKDLETPLEERAGVHHAKTTRCLVLDFEDNFLAGAKQLGRYAQPQLLVARPCEVITKGQLWIGLERTDDIAKVEQVTSALARLCSAKLIEPVPSRLVPLAGSITYTTFDEEQCGYTVEVTKLIQRGDEVYALQQLEAIVSGRRVTSPERPRRTETLQLLVSARNIENLSSALASLPQKFAVDYSLWLQIGFALHNFEPGPVGVELWQRFSRRCPEKADVTDFNRLWSRFGARHGGSRITIATLLHHAMEAGWRAPNPWEYARQVAS